MGRHPQIGYRLEILRFVMQIKDHHLSLDTDIVT